MPSVTGPVTVPAISAKFSVPYCPRISPPKVEDARRLVSLKTPPGGEMPYSAADGPFRISSDSNP